MMRPATRDDVLAILEVINEGAERYRGVVPAHLLTRPYMSAEHLERELCSGVQFMLAEVNGIVAGVMGMQPREDVCLIRHAYVRTSSQGLGIGSSLLRHHLAGRSGPILLGTWGAAAWAIRFYEKHGFTLVPQEQKDALLDRYWGVPPRQAHASVVLADPKWFGRAQSSGA